MLKVFISVKLLMKSCGFVYVYMCNWSATSSVAERLSLRGREYEYLDVYISAERIVKHFKCCDMID